MEIMKLQIIKIIKYAYYILFIPLLLIIRLLRPFIILRFDYLSAVRIGHFALNTEVYLARKHILDKERKKYIDFFSLIKPICNNQLKKIIQKKINIVSALLIKPIYNLNLIIPGGEIHRVFINFQYDKKYINPLYHDKDPLNILNENKSFLQLSKNDIAKGNKILKEIGIPENAKIVCIATRDEAYLNQPQFKFKNFFYHEYRNSNIENYYLTMNFLVESGYYVFRMGSKVSTKLKINNPKIIDYACSKFQDDFLDIFLGHRCSFAITDTSGWSAIPEIFRKPILFTNLVPIGLPSTRSYKHLILFKKYFSKSKKRLLNLNEIFSSGAGFFLKSSQYKNLGIKLIENSPNEILYSTKTMLEQINSNFKLKNEEKLLQYKFWKQYEKNYKTYKKNNETKTKLIQIHGELKARIPSQFLKENQNWLI